MEVEHELREEVDMSLNSFVLRPLYFVLRMYDHKDAWSQADAIREQQLNWRQSRSS